MCLYCLGHTRRIPFQKYSIKLAFTYTTHLNVPEHFSSFEYFKVVIKTILLLEYNEFFIHVIICDVGHRFSINTQNVMDL